MADYSAGAPYDVVLVGDSFLHGWCHQVGLAEHLRSTGRRVVNTAIAGSHPYQYSSVIRQIIANPRPPKIAILGIYLGNDYGTCSGCEKRYSLANETIERLYEYSPQLSRHVLRDRPQTRAYYAALAALQDEKTKQLIGESTRQFLKLGELRRFLRGLFSMSRDTTVARRSDLNPDVLVSPKPVEQSVVDLLRVCRAQNACKPILVTIPSNEPGESTGLRARIRAQHMEIIERAIAVNPSVIHIDLGRRDAGIRDCSYPLYDQPGKHLSLAGQRCMNEMVANAVR